MHQEHGVAGIDPHKQTATIAVVDHRGGLQGCVSFPISADGIEAMLAFSSTPSWFLTGSAWMGRHPSAGRFGVEMNVEIGARASA